MIGSIKEYISKIMVRTFSPDCNCYVKMVITAAVIGVGFKVTQNALLCRKKKLRLEESLKPENKDVVILHQFPRGVTVPNISPFPVKLETYLRLAKIPYKNDHRDYLGAKGKCPYITLNGVDICDSALIIEYLNEKYNIDLNQGLSPEDRATGRAFRLMFEDHLYWAMVLFRWVYDKDGGILKLSRWPYITSLFIMRVVGGLLKKKAHGQGMGRHTKKEVTQMAIKDLQAASEFLGKKAFLFGDRPTEEDCAIFGILIQFLWTMPGSVFEDLLHGECSNLRDYCLRMKETVWPDWDKHIRPKCL